ncbi:MAG: hypothetical protein GY781_12910 [Gammaproteobacteria bacterium]|nr:hypothetical protein [Gammaproteobacteria bacterium]
MEVKLDTDIKAKVIHSKMSRNYELQKKIQKLRPSKFERIYILLFCFSLPVALFVVDSYYELPIQAIWTLFMGISILSTLLIMIVQYIENIHKRIDLLEESIKNDS